MSGWRERLWYPVSMGRVGRGTLLSMSGLIARAMVQGIYLVLLSRWMGPDGYGLFSGIVAAGVVLAPLAGWGVLLLLTERVTAEPHQAQAYWKAAVRRVVSSGAVLAVLYGGTMLVLLSGKAGWTLFVLVALAELVLLPVTQAAGALCLALGRAGAAAGVVLMVPTGRLSALLLIPAFGLAPDAATVVVLHFAGTVAGALLACVVVSIQVGWPWGIHVRPLSRSRHDGTRYALGAGLGVAYQEMDKVMLLQLAGSAVAGHYTAAFRIASVLVLPIAALMGVVMPRLFSAKAGIGAIALVRALVLSCLGYGSLAFALLLLAAPWVAWLLGAGFDDASGYLRLLGPWPLLFAMHQIFGALLTASGRQGLRIAIEGVVLLASLLANLIMIPVFAGHSAAVTLLVAEALMALLCAWAWRQVRREGTPADAQPRQALGS